MLKVSSAINQSLQVMRSCELLQFRIAAMSVEDLKKQATVAEAWITDFAPQKSLEDALRCSESSPDVLASSTQCKKNGLSICYLAGHAADEGPEGAGCDAAQSKQQQAMLANDMSTDDVRSDIRIIDRVTAQNNMMMMSFICSCRNKK
jgi:hypothetical protein